MCVLFWVLVVCLSPPVLQGGTSCEIENQSGVVTLRPLPGTVCMIKDREVTEPCRLAQGRPSPSSHTLILIPGQRVSFSLHFSWQGQFSWWLTVPTGAFRVALWASTGTSYFHFVSLSYLSSGTLITLGGVHKFRFNHPAEAEVMREQRRVGTADQ